MTNYEMFMDKLNFSVVVALLVAGAHVSYQMGFSNLWVL